MYNVQPARRCSEERKIWFLEAGQAFVQENVLLLHVERKKKLIVKVAVKVSKLHHADSKEEETSPVPKNVPQNYQKNLLNRRSRWIVQGLKILKY